MFCSVETDSYTALLNNIKIPLVFGKNTDQIIKLKESRIEHGFFSETKSCKIVSQTILVKFSFSLIWK